MHLNKPKTGHDVRRSDHKKPIMLKHACFFLVIVKIVHDISKQMSENTSFCCRSTFLCVMEESWHCFSSLRARVIHFLWCWMKGTTFLSVSLTDCLQRCWWRSIMWLSAHRLSVFNVCACSPLDICHNTFIPSWLLKICCIVKAGYFMIVMHISVYATLTFQWPPPNFTAVSKL